MDKVSSIAQSVWRNIPPFRASRPGGGFAEDYVFVGGKHHGLIVMLLNIAIVPGLGSLIGRRQEGVTQLVCAGIALFISLALAASGILLIVPGMVLLAIVWLWGMASGLDAELPPEQRVGKYKI